MALSARTSKWFERFFPGLLADIVSLGPGEFQDGPFKVTPHGDDGIKAIRFELTYRLSDGHQLIIQQRLVLRDESQRFVPGIDDVVLGAWEPIFYRLKYGRVLDDSIFRFELHELTDGGVAEHHVHVTQPERGDHLPASEFDPDPTNMDPRTFVKLVAKYRSDKTYPVVRKAGK